LQGFYVPCELLEINFELQDLFYHFKLFNYGNPEFENIIYTSMFLKKSMVKLCIKSWLDKAYVDNMKI